jgi:alpha-2-macroglobulin
MLRAARSAFLLLLCLPTLSTAQTARSAPALRVVSAGPQGEVAALAEANEVRVVFSEPMVTLGRIPDRVRPPFFKIAPAVPGTFRWSGTTILIFTPDPKRPLPLATRYDVTIDTTATAVSGRKLREPYAFSFTTPTVKLLSTKWYRRGGNVANPIVVLMRFNQPVRGADVLAHLAASLEPHDWRPPSFTAEEQARLKTVNAKALDQFAAKVAATRTIAAATTPVQLRLTNDWDKKKDPPSPALVVFESTTPVVPESWVKLQLDAALPSPAGRATPATPQSYTVEVEPAFFVEGFSCRQSCDPDDYNPVRLRNLVKVTEFSAAVTANDITAAPRPVAKAAKPKPREEYQGDDSTGLTIEDAGFDAQPPNRKYVVTLAPTLKSVDGQTLGYPWLGIVDNWHRRAFTSFGDGHGVWEKSGGAQLPFYARNFLDIRQWVAALQLDQLMPTLVQLQAGNFRETPPGPGAERKLGVAADQIQSHGMDLTPALRPGGTGLVWTAVREGQPIARAHRNVVGEARDPVTHSSVVQVTNLGISVKDSPQNTLVFVTRLDTGAPVQGASVSIVRLDNRVHWRGTTGNDGVAIAPQTPLRDSSDWSKFSFIVTAEKDGDVAYVGSDWNEGIEPWEFGTWVNLNEASPLLRGSVFTDRGVYRLGEEVHVKAVLRQNAPAGIRLLAAGTGVFVTIRDSQNRVVDERTVKLNQWSSAEWTLTLPADGSLGSYNIQAVLDSDRPKVKPGEDAPDIPYWKYVAGSFLVAAYRRPDFRVDVSLTGQTAVAGDPLKGVVTARYLFGAPIGARPVTWRFTKSRTYEPPNAIREQFADERWVFVGYPEDSTYEEPDVRREETTLAKTGDLSLPLETKKDAGYPYVYSLEADVEDVSRQHIANSASMTVHPAPWYIGVLRPSYFLDQKTGMKTQIVAAGLDGRAVAGVPVELTLTQVQWVSVRRAEGNGFYTWDSEKKEVPAGSWKVTTGNEPVPLDIPFANGGYFVLKAIATTDDGRQAITTTSFYVLGDGYTAWARYDHNRINLVPDRRTYKPGDTARIMIQSPWEQATALVTTEREGVRTHRQFALTSTQQSVSIPITDEQIPNVFVSVLLIKGRTKVGIPAESGGPAVEEGDPADPGKPAFRLGYTELSVEDRTKRLSVTVAANKTEYRPASTASVRLDVKDQQGRGTASEVTLWAVDYGVLSLTGYRTPDILGSVYTRKALQVLNSDSRQRIVSRRVLTPKGDTEGGGGGAESGAGTMRKDFRVLAFWVGSVTTDAQGRATVDVKLPESLTTYRIMAVAGDRNSRFGGGDSEIRVNKPLTLKPTFPRFLAVGDKALFGAVVTSQLPGAGAATVTIKSLDPAILEFAPGAQQQTLNLGGTSSVEARFEAAGRAVGRARVQMTVKMGGESDAFEDVIPVEILSSPETVAAYGEATDANATASETLTIPRSVVPGFGGLHLEMSSTAMVGLGEGARYLVEYPYGCAEQKGSKALALLLAADLGEAFSLPGMDPAKMRPAVQQTMKELERFQCEEGGFSYWAGDCRSQSPYLTAYLLHVFAVASDLKYTVDAGMRQRALTYLEQQLASKPPTNESWWPSYTAWQAFAIKVLTEGGRNQDSNINRVYGYRDRMPVFALAFLHDALMAKGESSGARVEDLRRRMTNAILPEAGSAHVEELSDPYLLWFWNSNVRTTAIVLNSLVKAGVAEPQMRGLVRWMMTVRKKGRWGNTQENAYAMESLVAYYRKYEATVPDFSAVVRLGEQELAREPFKGRSTESKTRDLPMQAVLAAGAPAATKPLTFTREGSGTLYYTARLRYASDALIQSGLDAGFNVERSYAPYVENPKAKPAATTNYKAGDLVKVTLTFRLTKERRFVAVTDPLPAGFEPVESWFATTARDLAQRQDEQRSDAQGSDEEDSWLSWWRSGGFDHVERHDDRVELFATRLAAGRHEFSYIVRATTAGTFRTAPAHAEEMYEPEVFGRTPTAIVDVKR